MTDRLGVQGSKLPPKAGTQTTQQIRQASSSGIPAQPLMPNAQAAYNSTNNRLANGQYDASGNQQAFSTYVLTYDAENRQVKVTDNTSGNVTTYSYDGTGQRVMKVAGSVTIALCIRH